VGSGISVGVGVAPDIHPATAVLAGSNLDGPPFLTLMAMGAATTQMMAITMRYFQAFELRLPSIGFAS
jgi:hypothetical protein